MRAPSPKPLSQDAAQAIHDKIEAIDREIHAAKGEVDKAVASIAINMARGDTLFQQRDSLAAELSRCAPEEWLPQPNQGAWGFAAAAARAQGRFQTQRPFAYFYGTQVPSASTATLNAKDPFPECGEGELRG